MLNQRYKEIIQKIFRTHLNDKIVWVYGSRIKGKAHEGSDLDLVIKDPTGNEISIEILAKVRDAISESNLPISVDILDWAVLPTDFQKEINEHHEIFPF